MENPTFARRTVIGDRVFYPAPEQQQMLAPTVASYNTPMPPTLVYFYMPDFCACLYFVFGVPDRIDPTKTKCEYPELEY
jgi:hypothetical protein